MQITENTIKPLISESPQIRLVYLFGSRVTERLGPTSDYDFALLLNNEGHWPTIRARFSHEVAKLLVANEVVSPPVPPDMIDVVLLNRAPIELAHAVISEGKLLFRRDQPAQIEYKAYVLSRYGDYLPVLRFFQQHRKREFPNVSRKQRLREALERTTRTLAQIRGDDRKNEN